MQPEKADLRARASRVCTQPEKEDEADAKTPPKLQQGNAFPTWQVGAALLLCAIGALAWSQQLNTRATNSVKMHPRVQEADGPETLEDALRMLEAGEEPAIPRSTRMSEAFGEAPKKKAKGTSGQKGKGVKVSGAATARKPPAPAAEDEDAGAAVEDLFERLKAQRPEAAAAKQKKRSKADDEAEEALERLEGKKSKRSKSSKHRLDDMSPDDILKEALGLSQGDKEGPSDEDLKKAKEIINDAMEKLGKPKDGKTAKIDKALENLDALKGEDDPEADTSHLDFAKLLKEEHERKPEYEIAHVKKEFEAQYEGNARQLMCSGCKLIAARFGTELQDHDVHDQEAPHLMLGAKRRAIDAACKSFRHLDVVQTEQGPRFEAAAASDSEEKRRIGQRLCMAVLEDARFDVLMKMMQSKVPHMSHLGATHKTNWERYMCAQRTRLCKRKEVREDDEDEED